MSEFNVAVVLDGHRIAAFNNRGQAEFWIRTLAKTAYVSEDQYTVVALERDVISNELQAYKDRVYEATVNVASDMTCSAVQQFLDEVGIDRTRYAAEAIFTVKVKYDDTATEIEEYDIERQLDGYLDHTHSVEVSRA